MEKKTPDVFNVSQENWSLHRKGYQDQKRHEEKVQEAIRKNLPDLISEESIVLSNGKKVVKIPMRSLDEYKIRFNKQQGPFVGQGDGSSEVGDVIGKEQASDLGGKGKQAGDAPGEDYYEVEVTLEEIEKEVFANLALPHLRRKAQADLFADDFAFTDIRKQGLTGNIDKKQTILAAIKRNALTGSPKIAPILQEDLRYKTWEELDRPESKAVVLAMMDTSGSMGNFEKYIARTFFFWMMKFLRTKYETVAIEFIAHHTEAKVVSAYDFFHKGESGGTRCSSAYLTALSLIKNKYPSQSYNIYPFHFSDGENISSDNALCLELVYELLKEANMFGYGEINAYNRYSTLMNTFKKIEDPLFRHVVLKEKADVYEALKIFFQERETII